jgi:hypothetical protein
MTPRASARSPTDSVLVDGTVRVAQNLINGLNFSLIDFWGSLQSSLGWQRQFSKPSELAFPYYFSSFVEIFKILELCHNQKRKYYQEWDGEFIQWNPKNRSL